MKTTTIGLALLAAACALAAETGITGSVTDPSGARVSRAAISVHSRDGSTHYSTVSSAEGEFRLSLPGAGEYLIEVLATGFSPASQPLRAAAGETVSVEVKLDVARTASRVVVTAAGTPQSPAEIAKAYDVVDSEEISRRAEFAIVDAVRLVPGVRVQQLGGPGSLARILTRGLRAFDTSMLIDGFRLRDVSAPQGDATAFWGDLLTVTTDRVEVLRGSGSSLYGTHATGGVLNLVTDTGGGRLHGEASAEGGGLGMARGTLRAAGGSASGRLQFSGGVTHLNVTRGVDDDDSVRNWSTQGSAQWLLSGSTRLFGRVFANTGYAGLNVTPFAAPAANLGADPFVPAIPLTGAALESAQAGQPFAWGNATFAPALNDPDYRRDSRFITTMAGLNHTFSPRASMRVAYQNLLTRRDNPNGPGGPRFQPLFNTSNLYDGQVDNLQTRADFAAGPRHLFSAGYDFERERYENLSTDQNPDPAGRVWSRVSAVERSHSVFGQDQIRLFGERLQISLSGRLQAFRLNRPEFEGGAPQYSQAVLSAPPNAYTGDAAVAWFVPSTGTKLRAHAGNGYRAPSLYERFGTSFFLGSFSPYGDPRLHPERSIGVDGGLDQYLWNSRARVSATYFYTRLREVIEFDFSGAIPPDDPFGRFAGYRNTGGGIARGVELSGEISPLRTTRVQASYTYTNSRERNSILIGGSLRSLRVFDHMFTLIATQSVTRHFDVTFDLWTGSEFLSPFFAGTGTRAFVFGGPRKADLVVSYRIPVGERALRLYTRIENLFDRVYFEDGFATPGVWAVAGLQFNF